MSESKKLIYQIPQTWYVAAASNEINEENPILARTIADEHIAFYRKADGTPVALRDACGHRLMPLSMGEVIDDTLHCPYHGARFDETGKCVFFPGHEEIPACAVLNYPLAERHGFIWIWLGSKALADESQIPDIFERYDDPNWTAKDGLCFTLACNYLLDIDNLMDSTHAQFVHPTTFGSEAVLAQAGHVLGENTFIPDIGEKHINYTVEIKNGVAGLLFHDGLGARLGSRPYRKPVDWTLNAKWIPPGLFTFEPTTKPAGASDDQSVKYCNFLAITPETATSCHNFARTTERLDDGHDPIIEIWKEGLVVAFSEDKIILEAQQARVGSSRLPDSKAWGRFENDQLSMIARGIINDMVNSSNAN